MTNAPIICGYCQSCKEEHLLPAGKTEAEAKRLLTHIIAEERIDIFHSSSKNSAPNPALSSNHLFGEGRGKMFGVLHYRKRTEKEIAEGFLYAFSGQYNGIWLVDGWVPPPFSVHDFQQINTPLEREIKRLTVGITKEKQEERKNKLKQERRSLSKELNTALQQLCILHNFQGESATLPELFHDRGIPTGTGECCTPKLLDFAARNTMQPLGLCEFFIGRETRSGSCKHAHFYPPCTSKCLPLLGFMLCGIKQ